MKLERTRHFTRFSMGLCNFIEDTMPSRFVLNTSFGEVYLDHHCHGGESPLLRYIWLANMSRLVIVLKVSAGKQLNGGRYWPFFESHLWQMLQFCIIVRKL